MLNPQIAAQLGASSDTKGVVIAGVDNSSDAARKGLQRGDIILTANYRAVTTPAELESSIAQAKRDDRYAQLLRIQRRGQPPRYVAVLLR